MQKFNKKKKIQMIQIIYFKHHLKLTWIISNKNKNKNKKISIWHKKIKKNKMNQVMNKFLMILKGNIKIRILIKEKDV